MTVQTINVGARVNDETAETVYSAFTKTNSNFSDLDTRVSSAESTVATLSADMTELQGLFGTDVEAATFTTKQNDLAVAAGTRILRWNGAGTTGITGIAAPSTARVVTIVNASTDYLLWLENENTASTAAYRFMLPGGFPAFLMPGDTITLLYDLTAARWRVLSWPNRGPAMGLTEFNDFTTLAGYHALQSGTGASATNVSASNWTTYKSHGVNSCSSGTSGSGRAIIGTSAVLSFVAGHGCAIYAIRATVNSTPTAANNFIAVSGFSDALSGSPTNGAYWEMRWNGTAAEWSQTVAASSVYARSVSGSPSPTASAMTALVVFMNSTGTRADFIYSVDGVSYLLAGVASSGLPAVSDTALMSGCNGVVHVSGATARDLRSDWIGSRYDGVRA